MKRITTTIFLSISISIGLTATPLSALSSPAKPPVQGSCPQYEELFRKYNLPVKAMSRISFRESRCNPKSISAIRKSTGRPDVGLVQVQGSWATVTKRICKVPYSKVVKALTNVHCNLKVASYLYQNGGLEHWKVTSGN